MGEEVFPWLKSMPLAPEYHPTLIEFEDPISYIFKVEQEASKYGICKIIPPVSATPKKTIISNLNRFLSSQTPDSSPTFTTRQQQIGYWPRKHLTQVQRLVWESGESYTLPQFEHKAKNFEKNYLKKRSNSKKGLTDLERETLYWKAQVDKPFTVEYANDMSCSSFDHGGHGGISDLMNQRNKGIGDVMNVGESEWNMGTVSRAKGSLLKYLKEEIAGVNSPMVYIGMMFSWFAWHCEDHDLHSLNYMHMGAGKTWYGVPKDAAVAFEDVIRTHGYAGEISPIVTFATLVEKTTIMSPEVLLKAGIPCCRLVQNAGEFVVTFPRAYHSGFSHGFNCAEATNIATPGWLEVAQDAAIRRASIDRAPMVSHSQLLYDLACSFSTSVPTNTRPRPRSSRLKDRLKADEEGLVKRLFIQDIIQNNELINILGKESPVTVLSEDSLDALLNFLVSSLGSRSNEGLNSDGVVVNRRPIRTKSSSFGVKTADPSCVFSCVTCGIPCHACFAIVQPNEVAARYLISADLSTFNIVVDPKPSSEKIPKSTSPIGAQNANSALGLLALAYGDSSDSEEEYDQADSKSNKFVMVSNCSTGRFEYQIEVPLNSSARDEDSSRMHIFCLEHAREVDQRLRSVGGVHMLLLCHQDYPKLNDEARLMAEELGIPDHMWTDVGYKDINEHEKLMIKSALDNEESTYGKQDWAVRLGIDIFFSSRLCGTPLYRKEMPYNLVIYNTFCHTSPSNHPVTLKTLGRQKKNTVAGVWCGKVWMSNQVHPLLVLRDGEEQKDRITNVSVFPKVDMKREAVISKNMRKRKRDVKGHKKARKFDMDSGDESDYVPSREFGIRIKSKPKVKKPSVTKKAKKSVVIEISDEEEEGEFDCDKDGCNMILESKQDLMDHKKNICLECGNKFISHNYLVQHRRVHIADRPLECPWKGCKMTFKWAWARTEHVRVHTGERPYVCTEVGCGKTFRFVSDNSRHKRKTGHYVKRQDQEG